MNHYYLVAPDQMPAAGTASLAKICRWHGLDLGCHWIVVLERGTAPAGWVEIGNLYDPGALYAHCPDCLGAHGVHASDTMLQAARTLAGIWPPFAPP